MKERCNVSSIYLIGGKYAIVDIEDSDRVNKYKWRVIHRNDTDYAVGHRLKGQYSKPDEKRTIQMGRLVIHPYYLNEVHHINRDGLDNRKANLKSVSVPKHRRIHFKKQGRD